MYIVYNFNCYNMWRLEEFLVTDSHVHCKVVSEAVQQKRCYYRPLIEDDVSSHIAPFPMTLSYL